MTPPASFRFAVCERPLFALGFAGVHWASLEFAGARWGSLELAGVRWGLLGFAEVRWGSLGFAWVRLGSLDFAGVRCCSLGFAGVRRGSLEFAEVRWGSLGLAGVRLGSLGRHHRWHHRLATVNEPPSMGHHQLATTNGPPSMSHHQWMGHQEGATINGTMTGLAHRSWPFRWGRRRWQVSQKAWWPPSFMESPSKLQLAMQGLKRRNSSNARSKDERHDWRYRLLSLTAIPRRMHRISSDLRS